MAVKPQEPKAIFMNYRRLLAYHVGRNDNPERACAFGMDWRSKALGSVVKTYVAIGLLEMHFTANGTRWEIQTLLQQAFRVVRLASIWA